MKYRTRTCYTDSRKALMWERWKQGETLYQIAKLFDRSESSIQHILAESGGIRPPEPLRSRLALTLAEREEISRAVVAGFSIRTSAMILGRAPSTVSREIKRKKVDKEGYQASQARQLGIGPTAPSAASWLRPEPWHTSWRTSSNCSGRRNRLQACSSIPIRATRTATCRTRPAACSFKAEGP